MKTIRKRIVAIAAICALIMGLSLGGLSYYYSGHMATEDSETLMLAKSERQRQNWTASYREYSNR